jgi:hypothetical protein
MVKWGRGCESIFGAEMGVKQLGRVLVFEDERLHLRKAFWTACTVQINNEVLELQPIFTKG